VSVAHLGGTNKKHILGLGSTSLAAAAACWQERRAAFALCRWRTLAASTSSASASSGDLVGSSSLAFVAA
jgi:hypothetical protein